GLIRWLRPSFQAPEQAARPAQRGFSVEQPEDTTAPSWPRRAPEQYVALRAALAARPAAPADIARRFAKAPRHRMKDMLEALVAMGQARRTDDGRYVA
ncbi:MAG: hypothetical protein ABI369_02570, partial [Acetobacteraceae bacterium]